MNQKINLTLSGNSTQAGLFIGTFFFSLNNLKEAISTTLKRKILPTVIALTAMMAWLPLHGIIRIFLSQFNVEGKTLPLPHYTQ